MAAQQGQGTPIHELRVLSQSAPPAFPVAELGALHERLQDLVGEPHRPAPAHDEDRESDEPARAHVDVAALLEQEGAQLVPGDL
eukprot:14995913-Alexandrium_andersonii.AAC.1